MLRVSGVVGISDLTRRMRLLGAEIAVSFKKIDLPDVDFNAAKRVAKAATEAIKQGNLGYAIVLGPEEYLRRCGSP